MCGHGAVHARLQINLMVRRKEEDEKTGAMAMNLPQRKNKTKKVSIFPRLYA
jgi:hypothetical protein